MARPQKPSNNKSGGPTRKSGNALGYAKRQSLKSKTLSGKAGRINDVYEFEQEKVRRGKVKMQVDRDERAGFAAGSGSEDEGRDLTRGKRPRLVGELEDDEGIEEEDDEDIDSDAAFDEEDEERFAGFSFGQTRQTKPRQQNKTKATSNSLQLAEIDLNEDENVDAREDSAAEEASSEKGGSEGETEEEGDPEDFFDILDVLDGRANLPREEDEGEEKDRRNAGTEDAPTKRSVAVAGPSIDAEASPAHGLTDDEDMGDENEDEEGSGSEAEDDHISASEEEEEDDSALENLEAFVTSLDAGQKRKLEEETGSAQEASRARKRRFLAESTEAGEENEFAATAGEGKLGLDDLLAPLAQSSNVVSLRKSAKILANQSGSAKTLSAPLPTRTAERLDREAAYEQTKEEVDKWKATMQRIREAEHLSFPLQAQPAGKTSNLELAAKFKPTTELESAVDKLLKSAKMREEDLAETEALKMNHLSVEEVQARRAELAKTRDLMFRAEAKAKRVAKIKSKTYRRIKKKQRQKLAEKLGEDDEDLDDEEARMKHEMERARERATLRHKATGKWAKAMKARGELDEDQRRDINEMLDRGEKLRRKIRGERDSEESDDESGDDDEDEETAMQRIRAQAFEELKGLEDSSATPARETGEKGKGIFGMKFMKDAMARDQRRVAEEVDDFVKQMGGSVPGDDEEEDVEENQESAHTATVHRAGGRVTYVPGAHPLSATSAAPPPSDTSSVTLKSTDFLDAHQVSPTATSPGVVPSVPLPSISEANPWLARASESGAVKKKHEIAISKNSASAEKSKDKLRKDAKKLTDEKQQAKDDATVEISMTETLAVASGSKAPEASMSKKPVVKASAAQLVQATSAADNDDSDVNSEIEEQERLLDRKGKGQGTGNGVKAFEQRDLVALAFAGDKVVQDFAEQKRREINEDAPKQVDTTLPGWGSWGGKGAKKAPPKSHLIKKVAGVDPRARADAGKSHVIISEKRDKKAAKYQVKDLPYPYTSRAQFERSLETPIGTEWNTRVAFQRTTLPKVVRKPGVVITPLEKLL